MSIERRAIVELSRALADPGRDLVVLAEGNTSMRMGERMLVKASGRSMRTATAEDFVEIEIATLTDLVANPASDDAAVAEAFAQTERAAGRRPSVEALLHAVCVDDGAAQVVGHTHPVHVNALLCSDHAELLATHALFPDQVVVLGRRPLYVPYADPGLELARRVRERLLEQLARHGEPPRAIYLGNHGLFALGHTPEEVLQITEMAVKTARILAGALAAGAVRTLSAADIERIDSRPDEQYRRRALAAARPAADAAAEGGRGG